MINLPGYQVSSVIHEGKNTTVYRAKREANGDPVIIKILKAEYPSLREVAKLRQEYELTESMNFEGVIRSLALENYNNSLALVQEDFGGVSLREVLRTKKISLQAFLKIAMRITDALGHIHKAGVIHKDIKPHNIIINHENGTVKIIDFGIASQLSQENQSVVYPDMLEGTLAYISPEQSGRMNRSIDYRTDFYSLGITFYEMLVGEPPFMVSDPLEIVHCHIARAPRPLHEVRNDVPTAISDIVSKLLSKNAEDRYQSAYGLKADLIECFRQLNEKGKIEAFPIGERDKSDKLQIPQKLYGREKETQKLLQAFDRISKEGSIELMLVSGYSGIGKSALISEVNKPIVERRGYFISGKFDQFNRDVPYSAIIQAFQNLMREILTEREYRIKEWSNKLQARLGENAQVVIDVIPEVELIIGKQRAVPDLPPAESQNRFNSVFLEFIRTFAAKDHPLVIFLDDLQWADAATLKLLQILTTDQSTGYLFVLGAYRDNEVDKSHPLMVTLAQLKKANVVIRALHLAPLDPEDVLQLVSDTLGAEPAYCKQLSDLIHEKTDGNPFFTNEFLKSLHKEGLLEFDGNEGLWKWDQEGIQTKEFSDNVVEFMATNIQKLPEQTQKVLKLASCVGNSFNLRTLAAVEDKPPREAFDDIWKAIEQGFVQTIGDNYKQIRKSESEITSEFTEKVVFRFMHDRVQQAAYALISESERQKLHLTIGRLLLKNISDQELDERLFDVTNQLNQGGDLIQDAEEKVRLAELNLKAARKARSSSAFEPALRYSRSGLGQLDSDSWKTNYRTTLDLYILRAECEYLIGNFEESDKLFASTLQKANTKIDKGRIRAIQIAQYANAGLLEKAVRAGIEGLKLFGVKIPLQPSYARVLLGGVIPSRLARGLKSIESLENHPTTKREEDDVAQEIMSVLMSPTYGFNQNTFAYLVCQAVIYSLRHGMSRSSAYPIGLYAALNGQELSLFPDGEKFSELSLKLAEKYPDPYTYPMVTFAAGAFVSHWTRHMRESIPLLVESFTSGVRSGNLIYSSYAAAELSAKELYLGTNLEEYAETINKYTDYVLKVQDKWMIPLLIGLRQTYRNLRGLTNAKNSFNDDDIEEESFYENIQLKETMDWYNPSRLFTLYLYEKYEEALLYAQRAERNLRYSFALAVWREQNFYYSLTLAALIPNASAEDRKKYWKQLEKNQKQLKRWAQYGPENSLHKYQLVQAEAARIQGRSNQAMELYDRAIEGARENGYQQVEALANELAGKNFLALGKEKVARTYLIDARYGYLRWGAIAKVNDLDEKYPEIMRKMHGAEGRQAGDTETGTFQFTTTESQHETGSGDSAQSGSLDLNTVMKASQALSSEIFLEQLLNKVMQIAIENAGAQRGLLLLESDGEFKVEAEGGVNPSDKRDVNSTELSDEVAPTALIFYVARTKENIVLGDASEEGRFTNSDYIKKFKPKSILCMPITRQGRLFGILYLENNLTSNAFTANRIEILKVISTQAAISLENARLVADETERQKLQKEMEMAKQVQTSILPNMLIDDSYEIAAHMTPAEQVGGDYYDYYNVNGHRWVAIGDVTGHGLNSGLLMLMAQTGFSTYLNSAANPDTLELFSALNKTLHMNMVDRTRQELYMTFTALRADSSGNFEHVGKHEDILVWRKATGKVEIIKSDGFWMGLVPDVSTMIQKSTFKLEPGDFITLYTDGVIECRNAGGEQFDTPRLVEVIEKNAVNGIEKVKDAIVQECFDFMDQMDDDITLFLMQKK